MLFIDLFYYLKLSAIDEKEVKATLLFEPNELSLRSR